MKITITEKALAMLRSKLQADQFLRVGVTEGGCAGLTYSAEIDSGMKAGETLVEQRDTIRLVADDNSRRYLDGLVIDYSDDLIGGGLKFTNSNTTTTCGCGASFNLAGFPAIEGGKCSK